MKKLFDKVGGRKREKEGSLVGKVVMVGQYSVRAEALVGEGGFATIYRCVDVKTSHPFALKHMRLGCESDGIRDVQHEAKTMARLKGHPNILKLHAVAFAGPPGAETDGFMLLDFCPLTLLELMTRQNFVLDDYLVYEVFQDVVWAVAHMHKCNPPLAHRDLKAENVLKNSEGRWVICDFGSSTARAKVYDSPAEIAAEEEVIRRTTTPAYRAPEMWDLYTRQRIDTAVDVWALGVLLYVLAFGKLPFQGDSKLSILYGKYEMPPGRPPAMRALIQDMLQVNPADRPDIFQVISKMDLLRAVLSSEPGAQPPPIQQQQQQAGPAQPPGLPAPPPAQPPPSNLGPPLYQLYPALPLYPQAPTTSFLPPTAQSPVQPYHYNVQPYPYPGHPLSQQTSPLQQPLPPLATHLLGSGGGAVGPHASPLQAGLMRPPTAANGAAAHVPLPAAGPQGPWPGGGQPPPGPLTAMRSAGGTQTPRPQAHMPPPHLQPHCSRAQGQPPQLHPAAVPGYPPQPPGGAGSLAPGGAAAATAAVAGNSPAGGPMLLRVPSRQQQHHQQPLSPSDGGAGGGFQPPSWPSAAPLPHPPQVVAGTSQPQTPQHSSSQAQHQLPQTPTAGPMAAAAAAPVPQQPLNLMDDETFPKAPATVLSANAAIEELLGGVVEAAVAVAMAPPAGLPPQPQPPPPLMTLPATTVMHDGPDAPSGSTSGTATPLEVLVAGPGFATHAPLTHSPAMSKHRHTGSAADSVAVLATRGLFGSHASGNSTPAGRSASASMGFGDDNVDWGGHQRQPPQAPQAPQQQPELLPPQQPDWGEQPAFGSPSPQSQPAVAPPATGSGRDVAGAAFLSGETLQTPRRQEPAVVPAQHDLMRMDSIPPPDHAVAHLTVPTAAPIATFPVVATSAVATTTLAGITFAASHPPPPAAVPAGAAAVVPAVTATAAIPARTVHRTASTGPNSYSNGGDLLSQLPLPSPSGPSSLSRPASRGSGGGSSAYGGSCGGSSVAPPGSSSPRRQTSDAVTTLMGLLGPVHNLAPAAATTTRGDEYIAAFSAVQVLHISPPVAPVVPAAPPVPQQAFGAIAAAAAPAPSQLALDPVVAVTPPVPQQVSTGSVAPGDGEETVDTPRPLSAASSAGHDDANGGAVLQTQLHQLASGNAGLEERVRELEQLVAAQAAALQQMALELSTMKLQQQEQQQGQAQWVWGSAQQETLGGQTGPRASAAGAGEQLGRRHTRHGSDVANGIGGMEERYGVGGTMAGTAGAGYGAEPWGAKLDELPGSSVAVYPPLRYEDLS